MPTYVYKFVDTGETIEVHQAFTDASLTEFAHPATGDVLAVKKVFTPVGVTFKGSGFFKTDNRGKKSAADTSSSDSKASGESKSSTDSASDSKSSDSKSSDSKSGSSGDSASKTTGSSPSPTKSDKASTKPSSPSTS